jgi:sodium-independent sulfate anion transporter 11
MEDEVHDSSRQPDDQKEYRSIFLPLDHNDGSNPHIQLETPYPGVFIYRFSEGFNYPNASHYTDYLVAYIFKNTRRTNPDSWPRPGDRPWNNPGPRAGKSEPDRSHLPTLKAIILDFSSVNNVDVTSIQDLIDVRSQLDRYASPDVVQWHVACIKNRWTKRALGAAGFGYPTVPTAEYHRWKPIFSVAEIGGAADAAETAANRALSLSMSRQRDVETAQALGKSESGVQEVKSQSASSSDDLDKELHESKAYVRSEAKRVAMVHGLNRPLFHIDLTSAVQSAVANVMEQERSHPPIAKRGVGTEPEGIKTA